MQYLLVDNGSLRPESVLNLRRVAGELGRLTGLDVVPASLLHSSKVPPEQLEGEPAVNLERRLRWSLEAGLRDFCVIPFFFGPTGAITDYLPQRLASLRQRFGGFDIERTPFLGEEGTYDRSDRSFIASPEGLASILAERVGEVLVDSGWNRPRVALVDHGSPLPEVTAVRDRLAGELGVLLGERVCEVAAASMERREGEGYAFNEPLLENLLEMEGWSAGEVVISMLFLSPGRHAGPGGDIAGICKRASQRHPGLRTRMTGLVGDHPGIIPILRSRLEMPREFL